MWRKEEIRSTEATEDPEILLHKCLQNAAKLTCEWGQVQAKENRQTETDLREKVQNAQLTLEIDLQSPQAQEALELAKEAMKEFEVAKAKWSDHILQSKWVAEEEECTKMYFKSF